MEIRKYQIEITETLNRIIEIEAESEEMAMDKCRNIYREGKVVLTSENFIDVEFKNVTDLF